MEKKSKKSIVIGMTCLLLVTLILLGLTYAYYRTRIIGNDSTDPSISVSSKKLEVTYSDNSAVVTADNFGPSSGLTKTFSVENTGNEKTIYTVVLENVENTFINESDIRYQLINNTTKEEVGSGFIRNYFIEGYQTQKILANISIDPEVKHDYILNINYHETGKDQSIDMGKTLSFKVNITGEVDNPRMVLAENAYQRYIISQKENNSAIDESAATTYVKNALTAVGLDATDAMVFENRAVVGSFVKAINAGAEIGDCINYDSPQRTDNICDWRILGASENGELEVVSKVTSYSAEHSFSCEINKNATTTSTPGYDKGEEQLANCAETFVDGNFALTARSITVEDINRITGYSPMNVGVKDPYDVGTYYEEGTLREYLNEITFSWGPGQTGTSLFVKSSNDIVIEKLNPTAFYPLNESSYDWLNGTRTFTYTRDYYSYYPTTLTSTNDENASVGLSTSSKAYAMLFENTDEDIYEYWLANKYIDIKPTSYEPVINWGMRIVSGKRITGITFWDSKNGTSSDITTGNANVKPVVNISNDININATETADTATGLGIYHLQKLN